MRKKFLCAMLVGMMGVNASMVRAEDPAPGDQVEQRLDLGEGKSVPYLIYLPEDYVPGEEKRWPLMLFLHGRGESNGPLEVVKKWGPPKLVERGEELPYILVSPQCPRESSWNRPDQQEALIELLDFVEREYEVDTDRIYLTGLSMGGYGSWRMAADHPGRFAAVVPICGGGNAEDAEKLKGLPIWVFHGTEDSAVPFERSVEMVEAIREAGGEKIRFTSLEGVGHLSWTAAYALPDLYRWLDRQKRSGEESR